MHTKIDANGDGKLALHEIMEFSLMMRKMIASKDIQTIIDEMDTDKDGKLNLPELLKDMESWGEEGEEDKAEVQKRKDHEAAKFQVADTNGDGFLSTEELPALFYPETHDGVLALTAEATMKQKDVNGDGKLTAQEFWEGDSVDGEDLAISDEEQADFVKLDTDKDGFLSAEELKAWESGNFHTEQAMKDLISLSDKDSDMHVTAEELDEARELIAGSDAQYHLMEWAEHHEL